MFAQDCFWFGHWIFFKWLLDGEPLSQIVREVLGLPSLEIFMHRLGKHWPGTLSSYQDHYSYFKIQQQLETSSDRCATMSPKGIVRDSPKELPRKAKPGAQTESKASRERVRLCRKIDACRHLSLHCTPFLCLCFRCHSLIAPLWLWLHCQWRWQLLLHLSDLGRPLHHPTGLHLFHGHLSAGKQPHSLLRQHRGV